MTRSLTPAKLQGYGNPEEFSWWKTNMHSHIMSSDDKLWDILEDGVGDLALDEEGTIVDRKKHTHAQKKFYKKHHKIRGILVAFTPHTEYMNMSDLLLLHLTQST